jgi:hypothetical protein
LKWSAAREEWTRRQAVTTQHHPFNIWLTAGGTIRTHLSLFEQHSVKIDKAAAAELNALNGKRPMQLVLQRAQRDALLALVGQASRLSPSDPPRSAQWSVDPALTAAVHQAIKDYHSQRAPLYPLPEIQRLGYLDEEDEIVCKQPLSPTFKSGAAYPIRTHTVTIRRRGKRANLSGEMEEIEYTGQELCILVEDRTGREWAFMEQRLCDDNIWILDLNRKGVPTPERESKRKDASAGVPAKACIDFTLQQLIAHFIIPSVPDVATLNPEAYQRNLAQLAEIESIAYNLLTPRHELR